MQNFRHQTGDATGQIVVETIDPLAIKNDHTYQIGFEHEGRFDKTHTTSFTVVDITGGARDTVVARSQELNIDAVVFDGLKLSLLNDELIKPVLRGVHWSDTTRNLIQPVVWDVFTAPPFLSGKPYPANYAIEFGEMGVDSSAGINLFGLPPATKFPVNFRIRNVTENRYIKFNLFEFHRSAPNPEPAELRGRLDEADILTFFEPDENGNQVLTYGLSMSADSTAELPGPGDTLYLPVRKPFLSFDTFVFTARGPQEDVSKAQMSLDSIKVVPNPYVATAIWEPRNVFTSGRGTRSIHFIHLPRRCTIRIYNVRGELVDTIEHDSPITNGTADWDLLSRDRLDIAYGIYIYHVDAPGIGEKIGKFAIIK
ncbi:MAG: hypothetical protein D6715_00255 [Calditrichaeota bacterium]|nr:MAG: hypothetical protein D6715_00255 [Calditrichota bacterium]